jgi:hypothetical protein
MTALAENENGPRMASVGSYLPDGLLALAADALLLAASFCCGRLPRYWKGDQTHEP